MNANVWTSVLLYVLFVWSLIWKGLALWHAAKLSQKNWFVVMLVLNTVGILELVYLFYFAKKKFALQTLRFWENWKK
jgi:predicted membrane channel-forming protein YqfA (hemolysin III family)